MAIEEHAQPKHLPQPTEAAWLGLLRAHAQLTRALDAELAGRHGVSLSAYEVLALLARDEHLRMTALAAGTQLSLSRVSRVMDLLESRGLTARRPCPTDSRVVHATITEAGRALVAEAQRTFHEVVDERFLGRLSCEEVAVIGDLFAKLVEAGPPEARAS